MQAAGERFRVSPLLFHRTLKQGEVLMDSQDQAQRKPKADQQTADDTGAAELTLDKDTLRDLQAPVGDAEKIRGGMIPKRPTGGGDAV